ncbi:MAG: polysulfide reductase NrfD [Thaumarchaeota archaeon]|nr:polysulfide reductase NrfD [Candidatus Calditenuaceae archaeon]MDW8041551.1 4Fe-4S dicluster domain-containing protein [Nitrososphaerota archaeon]
MTRFAFVIDQSRCIGCHACTVACKMENHVPVGVFRTWVKYIERGEFPNSRRFYAILRCNHCDNAPCVRICPTSALYYRSDGIVDFDKGKCIGCKACMQACPYDALYIDPDDNTAAKCHFCAHRIEQGLEPACVIVCPTRAILWGDIDDPASSISKVLRDNPVTARKPEQGTKPKLYYIGADQHVLTPMAHRRESTYMWSDVIEEDRVGGALATDSQVAYDIPHSSPWGLKIATYIYTKAIATGLMVMLSILMLLFPRDLGPQALTLIPLLSLFFLGVTALLLVLDLKRPLRFVYVILRPNLSSWLSRGSLLILAFGLVIILWILWRNETLIVPTLLIAGATAGYSGLLFGQCEGRDFWQSPSALPHFVFTAPQAGTALLVLLMPVLQVHGGIQSFLGGSLALWNTVVTLIIVSDLLQRHTTTEAEAAKSYLVKGRGALPFWTMTFTLGGIVSTVMAILYSASLNYNYGLVASLASLSGLAVYEALWIRAGQIAPLS